MIKTLSIKNYIIIENIEIKFDSGFSVITGETGAGKSIIIGAISLLQGKRADCDVLSNKNEKCIIEATFDIGNLKLEKLFSDNDVDYERETIVRREILPEGKSRAFINDMPVTLTILKNITEKFIDIHSQHENLSLTTAAYRLNIIDSAAATTQNIESYKQKYNEFTSIKKSLEKKKNELAEMLKDIEYYRFQTEEIEKAKLGSDDELNELENRSAMLENAEEIKTLFFETSNIFSEGEFSANSLLKQMKNNVSKIARSYKPAEELQQRIESILIELSDIDNSIMHELRKIEVNPELLELTNSRIDLILSLLTKHNAKDISELKQKYSEYKNFVDSSDSLEIEISELTRKYDDLFNQTKNEAEKLSQKRSKAFAKIEKYINFLLNELGMPHAIFQIKNDISSDFGPNGIDNILFLFSANKSVSIQAIEKVASGGELSRLMLALKSLMAESMEIPTILFDEIDTGVSGEIAAKMGKIMNKISETVQVLSITHLPQVAAMGNTHYKVFKQTDSKRTISNIKVLSEDERIKEIAAMMSGEKLTNEALENAKSLLKKE